MQPLPREATTEDKTNISTTPSYVPLKSTNYSRRFGFMHQDTSQSTQTVNGRLENLECEGVVGSLRSATIKVNFH